MDALNNLKSLPREKRRRIFIKTGFKRKRQDCGTGDENNKDFTGIDLMDDAVMSSIATDLIGNSRQKGLFRQEITKAGLDAEALLTGKLQSNKFNV